MITAYFKPTNFCNVGCSHCYLPESVRANAHRMDRDGLRRMADLLADMQAKTRQDTVHIIWHGGEPLTLHPEYFWEAGEVFDQRLPGHLESIQTSLIPYSDRYADVVRHRFGGEIGTSLDFQARRFKGDAGAYQRLWMDKVTQAREAGFLVTPLVTPSRSDVDHAGERLDWFVERGFDVVHFERYNKVSGELPDWPDNAEHARFLTGLFDRTMALIDTTGQAPMVRQVMAAIGGVLYDQPGDRWGGNCQSEFVVIEPDGSLNTCPDKASFEPPMANLTDGYAGFSASPARKRWIRLQVAGHRIHDCAECENNRWCKSGCPINPQADPHGGEVECAGFKGFLNHVRRYASTPQGRARLVAYHAGEHAPQRLREAYTALNANLERWRTETPVRQARHTTVPIVPARSWQDQLARSAS